MKKPSVSLKQPISNDVEAGDNVYIQEPTKDFCKVEICGQSGRRNQRGNMRLGDRPKELENHVSIAEFNSFKEEVDSQLMQITSTPSSVRVKVFCGIVLGLVASAIGLFFYFETPCQEGKAICRRGYCECALPLIIGFAVQGFFGILALIPLYFDRKVHKAEKALALEGVRAECLKFSEQKPEFLFTLEFGRFTHTLPNGKQSRVFKIYWIRVVKVDGVARVETVDRE